MTPEMWRFQMGRMQAEFARRRLPWLAADEERALLEYLEAHASRG